MNNPKDMKFSQGDRVTITQGWHGGKTGMVAEVLLNSSAARPYGCFLNEDYRKIIHFREDHLELLK